MKKLGLLLIVIGLACGKRGDPRPPVPVIPQATSDLVVTQRANRVVLSWSYPSLTTAGRSLPAVRRVIVYRSMEEVPPSTVAGPATLAPAQFAKLSTRIDSIEGANLASATTGSRLSYEETPPSGRPVRLTYGVVTEGVSARSELSNLVSIVPLNVAVAPPSLTTEAKAEGVTLRWEAPKAAATDARATPVIVGYNIYRDPGDELTKPVNPSPVTGTTFTDAPTYGDHRYVVTAVASVGPPLIESEASPAANATFKNLLPPPPPTGLSALIETSLVRLVWDPVDAPDLAGYKIFRMEGVLMNDEVRDLAGFVMTPQPIVETNFSDPVQIGISYRYEVRAVDKSGNESAPAKTGWVLVPKTP